MSKDIKDFLQGVDNADAVAKIISDNLKDAKCKLFIDDGEKNIFVPKSRLDAKIEAQVKDDDKAKETIQSLQTDLDNYKKALKDSQIDSALQLCAVENKAHDAKDLKGFLDMGKISIGENGEVIGIKEQVENLKKEKAYLFEASEPEPQQQGGKNPFNGTGVPGKQASGFVFNSQTAQPGDFGKMLAHQNGVPKAEEGQKIGPEYFFGDN